MENLNIQTKGNELTIKLNLDGFDKGYIIELIKRLQIEAVAQRSGITEEILQVAEDIKRDWWEKNGAAFMAGTNLK